MRGEESRAGVSKLIVVGKDAAPTSRYAARSLAKGLLLLGLTKIRVATDRISKKDLAGNDIISIGTPEDNRLLAELLKENSIETPPNPQGFVLLARESPWQQGKRLIAVCGSGGPGTV